MSTSIADVLGGIKDAQGRWVYGDPNQGCRHCGHVARKVSANGKAVLYHPGAECCKGAIADQIKDRHREIHIIQERMKADEERLKHLSDEMEMLGRDSKSKEANTARWHEERAYAGKKERTKVHLAAIAELQREIRRLEGLP